MHPVIEVNNGTYIMGRGGSVSPTDRVFKDNIIGSICVAIILGSLDTGGKTTRRESRISDAHLAQVAYLSLARIRPFTPPWNSTYILQMNYGNHPLLSIKLCNQI